MNYENLIIFLNNHHFYPHKQISIGKKGEVITGLQVTASLIIQDSRKNRLEEVLEGTGAIVSKVNNEDYLLVKLKKQ